MSGHFSGKEEIRHKTSIAYLLDPRRPRSAGEQRFIYHGYFRAALVFALMTYFVYCNPEYSYTYSALRARYKWDEEPPMLPQYFKIQVGGKGDGFLPLPKSSPPELPSSMQAPRKSGE